MTQEVAGIPLTNLEEPIRNALQTYSDVTEGRLQFDLENAGALERTPDKPNSARSRTIASYADEQIGDFYVIAFQPGDGTGDENSLKLADYHVDAPYPLLPKIVPRRKTGIHSEALFPLVSYSMEQPNAEPVLFAGGYDLLGLRGNIIGCLAVIGQSPTGASFIDGPKPTFTVGYYAHSNERFGDPHAIYSRREGIVQVCGFLAVSDELQARSAPQVFADSGTRLPNI